MSTRSGSIWSDEAAWERAKEEASCVICQAGEPGDVLIEFDVTWLTAGTTAPLPGYACVVAKRHVVEPFELPDVERNQFWTEAMVAASGLQSLLRPAKMNYEIHGNTVPHLHMHLFPRYAGDPYVGGPVDPTRASFNRSPEQLREMADAVMAVSKQAGQGASTRR